MKFPSRALLQLQDLSCKLRFGKIHIQVISIAHWQAFLFLLFFRRLTKFNPPKVL